MKLKFILALIALTVVIGLQKQLHAHDERRNNYYDYVLGGNFDVPAGHVFILNLEREMHIDKIFVAVQALGGNVSYSIYADDYDLGGPWMIEAPMRPLDPSQMLPLGNHGRKVRTLVFRNYGIGNQGGTLRVNQIVASIRSHSGVEQPPFGFVDVTESTQNIISSVQSLFPFVTYQEKETSLIPIITEGRKLEQLLLNQNHTSQRVRNQIRTTLNKIEDAIELINDLLARPSSSTFASNLIRSKEELTSALN